MYSMSSSTSFSNSRMLLRPAICQYPVTPGKTLSLRRWASLVKASVS